MSELNQQTTVSEVEVDDLDALFDGAPGADSVTLPTEETKKPNVLSNAGAVDMSFLEGDSEEAAEEETENSTEDVAETKEDPNEILAELDATDEEEVVEKKKTGRAKKGDPISIFNKLFEDEVIIPFDDDKGLEEYSVNDWKELIEANYAEREKKLQEEVPRQFFEALPEELQYAAKYVMDGGQDLKGLFRALSSVEEQRQLDVSNENDQERIVRQYLQATGFGNDAEIADEIETWKDLGRLEQQAKKWKPKLDAMQEEVIAQRLAEQEQMKAQQEKASQDYMDNVYTALKEGELNGVKLDKKTQSALYAGLVQPNYNSVRGGQTNLLGHLLEKYQFVEPNYTLISEALWLLSDPEGYRGKIAEIGKKEAVEKTVRQLKTEQSKRLSSTAPEEKETKKGRSIPRQNNIFKRF
jgi:hypothetical protein